MENGIRKVLILCAGFYPGFRSGGPQQTVANIVEIFGDKADIYILTQNHDLGVTELYEGIDTNVWIPYGKANVKYLSTKDFRYSGIKKEYKKFDIILSCGMFELNTNAVLLINWLSGSHKKLYVASMGVFSERAINSKKTKKILFLYLCKRLGMLNNVIWSFTSEIELGEAQKILGEKYVNKYIIAEDIPKKVAFESNRKIIHSNFKELAKLKIVFISRICTKKNLDFCFDVLAKEFKGDITFDIYGTIEDKKYWEFCQQKADKLQKYVHVKYCGSLHPEQVIPTMLKYDIFFFPTKGENYGHVIYEAFCAGCIPLITDTTPWEGLDALKAGNVIAYGDINSFHRKISEYLNMEDHEFKAYKENAISYAEKKYENTIKQSGYKKVFCE